jgi:hypothetical protein
VKKLSVRNLVFIVVLCSVNYSVNFQSNISLTDYHEANRSKLH